MLNLPGCLMLLAVTFSLSPSPETQPAGEDVPTGFLYKTIKLDGETYAYCAYIPPDYSPERPWPVILFLHGSGERGTDGLLQTEVGIGTAIRRNWKMIPAIVVMPQCRPQKDWLGSMTHMALKCVEAVSREYHCDRDRLYLTGLSLGGQGAWHLAAALPGTFAAVVPLCGFAEYGESTGLAFRLAARLTDVAVWCFHGDADPAVPVGKTREMVTAIRQAGGTAHYTEYKGLAHNVWDRAYADPELWRWLFAQRRGASSKSEADRP